MPWDLQDPKGHIRGQQWETNGLEAGKGSEQGRAVPPFGERVQQKSGEELEGKPVHRQFHCSKTGRW